VSGGERLPPPAGELNVDFEAAGIRLRLLGFPVAAELFLEQHYPGFHHVGSQAPAALVLQASLSEQGLLVPLPPEGEPPVVEVEETRSGRLLTRSHWHEAELDFASGRGAVSFRTAEPTAFRMSLENFLRVAFANLLLRRGACLVHAAAVTTGDGRADVFFGLSGSGKSRLVELLPDRPALSDDMVALVLGADGTLVAERVPFHGEFPSGLREAGSFPVRHLLRAQRGEAHELRSIPAALQAARLRACLPFLGPDDERALELAARITAAHPAAELEFADDAGFLRLLD
jgi:hypothetical protein